MFLKALPSSQNRLKWTFSIEAADTRLLVLAIFAGKVLRVGANPTV